MTDTKLRDGKRIVFFTGAGMSAESGIPTYRGKGGMWSQYNYEDFACQPAFDRDPEKVWEFHNTRRKVVDACKPNEGHKIIAGLERELPNVTVVTQNIDGMHQRAGSTGVWELHGSLWKVRCDSCGVLIPNEDVPMTSFHHRCGHYLRPHIVWFGDQLFGDVIQGALQAIQSCDILVSIGTSAVVFPAAEFPLYAKQNGATLIEINPEETPLSGHYDIHLRGTATEMLQQLIAD